MHLDLKTKQPLNKVLIGLVNVKENWQIPAALKYGGWNASPFPEEHCAVMKYWSEKYKAEIVCASNDVIECTVSKPPLDDYTALELAKEQYAYCTDLVDQGFDSVGNLASSLVENKTWYFWWD